jgi:cell wall assembly regulator SMI1
MANRGASDPVFLTEDLLEQLAARWREQGMPIVESLRPGLSDAEMDELTQPLGVLLPREARTWWGWHNGADAGSADLGPGRCSHPLPMRSGTP